MQKNNFLNKTQSEDRNEILYGIYCKSNNSRESLKFEEESSPNWALIPQKIEDNFKRNDFTKSYEKCGSKSENAPWTQNEDLILVSRDSPRNSEQWAPERGDLPGRSPEECLSRRKWLRNQFLNNISWTFEEQLGIYRLLDQHGFTWKKISQRIPLRTSNAIKGLVHASLRKILKTKSVFWCLYKFARWPTFTNKSK